MPVRHTEDPLAELEQAIDAALTGEVRARMQHKRFIRSKEPVQDRAKAASRRAEHIARQTYAPQPGVSEQPQVAPQARQRPATPAATPVPARTAQTPANPRHQPALVPGPTLEVARISEQLVQARERLAMERARAQAAEAATTNAQQRIVAAQGLVREAQQVAREAVEHARYLEGKCDALEIALQRAVLASPWQRWRWARRFRKRMAAESSRP